MIVVVLQSYNTASGMSCCNLEEAKAWWLGRKAELQYRKRYELLQRMYWKKPIENNYFVTIPQAV